MTLASTTTSTDLPTIIVRQSEETALVNLAVAILRREKTHRGASLLMDEMHRASVVPDEAIEDTIVRMNSTVVFDIDDRGTRRAQLVFPADADINKGTISVLSPIGAALIGLSQGQTMRWQGYDGRKHVLTVNSVHQPSAA
jgi:regulator of nucleoside diphosphate kinase